jgi:hypothetical protein
VIALSKTKAGSNNQEKKRENKKGKGKDDDEMGNLDGNNKEDDDDNPGEGSDVPDDKPENSNDPPMVSVAVVSEMIANQNGAEERFQALGVQ